MNYRLLSKYVAIVMQSQAAFMTIPLLYSVFLRAWPAVEGFAGTIILLVVVSLILRGAGSRERGIIYIKEGFALVAVCWIVVSLFGALPFWISREIPDFIDALFESVSGFTTTGATILSNVEGLSDGMLLWRSLTHWIGGVGVLVFILALVPALTGGDERSVNVLRAELSGPAPGKLVPKLGQSAKILIGIYVSLTALQVVFLMFGGMPLLDSISTAFSTAATGGFAVKNASMAAYDSAYLYIVVGVFMLLFGISFNIYYFLMIRNIKGVVKNEELRVYLIVIAASTIVIALDLYHKFYQNFSESLLQSFFQVSSIITTTGFASTNYDLWPTLSKTILLILMLLGACSGSTGGGIKISRLIILVKEAKRILFRIGHPRAVEVVKLDGKKVDRSTVHAVSAFFSTYVMIYFVSFLLVAFDNQGMDATITSVLACITNVGPGFGDVGPLGNFSHFSIHSKIVLSLDMLLGRLEIYPILLLLSPRSWRKI